MQEVGDRVGLEVEVEVCEVGRRRQDEVLVLLRSPAMPWIPFFYPRRSDFFFWATTDAERTRRSRPREAVPFRRLRTDAGPSVFAVGMLRDASKK